MWELVPRKLLAAGIVSAPTIKIFIPREHLNVTSTAEQGNTHTNRTILNNSLECKEKLGQKATIQGGRGKSIKKACYEEIICEILD